MTTAVRGGGLAAAPTSCKARRCNALVRWERTVVGGQVVHLPIDVDPAPDGLLVFERVDGESRWRAFAAGRDNAKKRYHAHWDGLCKDRAVWGAERRAAGELGSLGERRAGDVWGTAFGPCAGCGESARIYGDGASPLCGKCQEVLEQWRAKIVADDAGLGGPPYRRVTPIG
ncbi:hypothetical protein [Actinoplanes sp. URMC 104]|uniref:hypothetical protein n=1 Tax=Actinoplanes sp. URMC 104 TaxID=3423409 RepID=UPI003F1BDD1C